MKLTNEEKLSISMSHASNRKGKTVELATIESPRLSLAQKIVYAWINMYRPDLTLVTTIDRELKRLAKLDRRTLKTELRIALQDRTKKLAKEVT